MTIYLSFAHQKLAKQAFDMAKTFQFEFSDTILPRLHLQEDALVFLDINAKPIYLNWNAECFRQRSHGERGTDLLIRATGASKKLNILDLTAGWGKDGLLLAQAGSQVTMLEKNPYMIALLLDAHSRLEDKLLQSRIQVIGQDAKNHLHALTPDAYPDVIYLDPMHPSREKSAKVKKHLQVLQTLVAPNDDVQLLIEKAQRIAKHRVVLKWPAKALCPLPPQGSLTGKTIRFDIYSPKQSSAT